MRSTWSTSAHETRAVNIFGPNQEASLRVRWFAQRRSQRDAAAHVAPSHGRYQKRRQRTTDDRSRVLWLLTVLSLRTARPGDAELETLLGDRRLTPSADHQITFGPTMPSASLSMFSGLGGCPVIHPNLNLWTPPRPSPPVSY